MEDALAIRINEILYDHWDPIGARELGAPKNEYSSYVSKIIQAINAGKGKSHIADMLCSMINEKMGLEANQETNLIVAEMILEAAAQNQLRRK